jgi:hypothetical protein
MKLTQILEAKYDAPPQFRVDDEIRLYSSIDKVWTVRAVRRNDEDEYWYTLTNSRNIDEETEEPEWELSPASEPHPRS